MVWSAFDWNDPPIVTLPDEEAEVKVILPVSILVEETFEEETFAIPSEVPEAELNVN